MAAKVDSNLLGRYCPVLIFHPDESYFPTSVEDFLMSAELHKLDRELKAKKRRHETVERTVIAEVGDLDPGTLLEKSSGIPARHLQLVVDGPAKNGSPPSKLDKVPVYAHSKQILDKRGEVEAIELNYIFFYAYNGPYVIARFVERGAHVGDWEHITVRLNLDGSLQGVYYNSHRNIDGDWVPANKVPRSEAGRPVVYVAKHGHGCYSRPGTHVRLFFLANDQCGTGRDGGVTWCPKRIALLSWFSDMRVESRGCEIEAPKTVSMARCLTHLKADIDVFPDDQRWSDFHGYWGTIANPTSQNWFYNAEHPKSRGWFKRLCCHCLPGK